MKPTFVRRYRRRTPAAKSDGAFFKKESQETFFGGTEHDSFFQPAVTHSPSPVPGVQRKCEECEKEDKEVQRQPEKKEEEKVMRAADPKKEEEEKVQRAPEEKKKEEEKVQRAPEEKKEEEKVQREPEKKEEEKLQRQPEKKEEDKTVQKKESNGAAGTGKIASHYIGSLNGKGQPLPPQANYFFSSKMGSDFSNVKIHKDKEAAESAKDVKAKAYTVGNNIVFNEGQYDLESGEGKKLMAHELTHVIQQNPSLQREPVDAGAPIPAPPQKSTLAQELEEIWYNKGKIAFFDRLRIIKPAEYNDTDAFVFILDTLTGDEKWLASNLLSWGPESQWEFTARVELELRSLPQSRGFAGVSALLKGADNGKKRSVLKVLVPELKRKLSKQEFAKVLVDLDIATLVTGAADNEKQWMLADDELMKLLKQELTAPQFTAVVTNLIDLKHLLPGVLRDTLVELLYSSEEIDRNTAKAVINGRIVVHYMEDLKRPANERQILAENKLDPAIYTTYIRPDNGVVGAIQKNYSGFTIGGTNRVVVKKSLSVERWKVVLVHETNHSMNPISNDTPLSTYQSEFRAYWVVELRHVADLDERARQVKAHILQKYAAIKEAYNSSDTIKKAIDAYTRPDGNITNF